MDKKSKILMWIMAALILGSIGVTFWRIVIKKDYIIEAQADCDPTLEKCFIYECDPEAEECTGDPVEDTSYYKLVRRNASNIPLCDPADENCQALVCGEDEKDCVATLCSDETKTEEDACNDPEQYNLNNPAVDEESSDLQDLITCDVEGDPACAAENADVSIDVNDVEINSDQSE